uniref:Ensconsin n=2 Tax=Schistocephalus solidus TaxID=70667 RepID=A0A0V0JAV4_SCHSO
MAQERRKELERQHQEHLQGLLERTRERTASVSETRSRLDHPDLNGGMPATMRTSQTLPSSSRPESSNRMCTSYTVAFGSGAPRSICTRISEAALRSQAAFEARLASYLTGRHSGCFLTSSSTYTNYALYVNPTLLPDNHPIHSLRSTHSPQHHKTARASARRAVSAAPSLTHAHSSSASPWNRAVDKGSKVVRASAQAQSSKGGAVELPLRPQRSKPVVANADAYAGPVKGEDNAQSRSRHHSYAAPTTASSARNCTVSKDHAPAPTAAHDPSQQPPVNRKPTANTRSRSQVRNAHERPIKTVTGSESTAHKTDTASKTQSVKSQRSTDTASVIKLKHTTPVKTPETNTTATAAPAEAESSPASVEDQEPPSTTEPVHTADDKAPAAAVEAVTEPAPKIKSPELSSADECPVPPDSTSTVDAFPAMETAPDVTDSPASPKSETVVSAPCSDDKVQLSSTETVNADVVVSKEVLNGVAKQEVAAESQGEQVEADTEVSSSSAAPPPNEALPPAAYSDQPSSEKCEPTPAGQEEAQETATPSSQPSSPPNEVMEDVVPVPTSSPAASKTQSPPPTAAPTPPLPSLVPSGPIAISTTGAGEGGSLPEEEAARYRAKMAEQRRLAKERKAAEEKRKAEEFELARQAAQERAVEEARLAREARAAAEAEAEQRRLQQQQQVAAATTAFAEESVHQNLEERAARDLEKRKELERQRLETLRHEEEERAKRRQKLESIMSRVKGSGQGLSRTNTGNSSTQSLSAMVQSLTADSKARSESPANGTDDVHFTLGGEEASLCAGSMRPYPDGEQQPQVFPSGDHVRQLAFHHDSASAAALYADSAVTNGHSLDADRSNGGGDIGEEPGHKLSSSSFKSPLLQSLLGRGRVAGVVSSGQMGDDTTHRLLSTPRMTSVDPH